MPGGPSSTTLRASVRNAAGGQGARPVAEAGWASKSKSSRVLTRGEPGRADPQPGAGGVAGDDFAFEDGGEVVLVGPAGVAGLVGQPGGGLGDPGRLQRGGQVGDLLDRLVARRSWCLGGHQLTSAVAGVDARRRGRSRPDPGPGRRPSATRRVGCWNCLRSAAAVSTWAGSVTVMPRAQTRAWSATTRPSRGPAPGPGRR